VRQLTSDNVLAQSSVHYQLVNLRTKFQVSKFLFSSLWQLDRGKHNAMNIQTVTENSLGESMLHNSFSGKFTEIWAKILCTQTRLAAPTHMISVMLTSTENTFF